MSARIRKITATLPALALVCSILSCLMPLSAHAQQQQLPEAWTIPYEAGIAALAAENYKEAIPHFDEAITVSGERWQLPYFGRGEAYRNLEDYHSASADYSSAILIDDKFARAINGRGICAREQGSYDLALNDFQTANSIERRNGEIAANLGDILVNQYRYPTQAMPYLDLAIEADPENAKLYRNRGWAHTMLREQEEALVDLAKAIELDPEDYETHDRLASVNLVEVEYEAAIASFLNAIKYYKPKNSSEPEIYVNGYLKLAETRLNFAKEKERPAEQRKALYNEAIADADTVLAVFPDRLPESGQALHLRGMGQRLLSRYAEAIDSFTKAIQLVPAGQEISYISESYRTRGICWFYQGQISLARGDFREAVSLNPDDPLPYLWIGFTYAEEEDYRKAIESYGEAAAKSPTFSLAYVNRGIAYMRLKDYAKAAENFNDAIRAEPTEPAHFCKRGVAYENLKDYEKALDSYTMALLQDKNLVVAHQGSARALRALGKNNLAEMHESKIRAIASPK